MNKKEIFYDEINYIKDESLRKNLGDLIELLPDYFFKVPASSTGKYHPAYTTGDSGLLRHTKAAVRIAAELFRLHMYSVLLPLKDHIIIALILHDGWKHGAVNEDGSISQYTLCEHAEYCANWILQAGRTLIDEASLQLIAKMVLTHMGQWNSNPRTGYVFAPEPLTVDCCFVHLCDYLASRKCLEMNFNVPFEGWNT